jgi:4-diphosphocytidyl-2-C-methyl-D-erythritol kinase
VTHVSAGPAARVRAQAKINLALRIFPPDASGYHPLETLFQRLDLHDVVTVTVTDGAKLLECDGPTMPREGLGPVERNLAWRAAAVYAESTGWPNGWVIEIDKRIPVGGGLGGGSADAGAVLRALNALAPVPLPWPRLLQLASRLGADVAFLTSEWPLAIGRGYGEQLTPVPPLPRALALLACSGTGVPTAEAYAWLDAWRAPGEAPPPLFLEPERVISWRAVSDLATNDFESVVAARHQGVDAALRWFRGLFAEHPEAGPIIQLSGSGATVFALMSRLPGGMPIPDEWQLYGLEVDEAAVPVEIDVLAQTVTATRVEPVERLA